MQTWRLQGSSVRAASRSVRKTTELLGWNAFVPEDCTAGSGLSRRAFNVCWCDSSVTQSRVMKMGRMQKINHFPGMLDLVRKAGTAWNLNKMLVAVGKCGVRANGECSPRLGSS